MTIDFTLLAMGLTALIGIGGAVFGLQFQGRYRKAMVALSETGILLGLLADGVAEITEAMKDQTLTPDELKSITQKLNKLKSVLEALKDGIVDDPS